MAKYGLYLVFVHCGRSIVLAHLPKIDSFRSFAEDRLLLFICRRSIALVYVGKSIVLVYFGRSIALVHF